MPPIPTPFKGSVREGSWRIAPSGQPMPSQGVAPAMQMPMAAPVEKPRVRVQAVGRIPEAPTPVEVSQAKETLAGTKETPREKPPGTPEAGKLGSEQNPHFIRTMDERNKLKSGEHYLWAPDGYISQGR